MATAYISGQDDAPYSFVRKMAGPDVLIGVSTNTIDEIKGAIADGADYVGFGPMYPTQSKKDANEVVSAEAIRYALSQKDMPLTCIGGGGPANMARLYKEGFRSFAMISAMNTMIIAKPKNARFIGFPPLASLYFYENIISSPGHSV